MDKVLHEPIPEPLHHRAGVAPAPMGRSRVRLLRHRLALAKRRAATLPQQTARPLGRSEHTDNDLHAVSPIVTEYVLVIMDTNTPANIFTPVYTNSDEGPILLRPSAVGVQASRCSRGAGCRRLQPESPNVRLPQSYNLHADAED